MTARQFIVANLAQGKTPQQIYKAGTSHFPNFRLQYVLKLKRRLERGPMKEDEDE